MTNPFGFNPPPAAPAPQATPFAPPAPAPMSAAQALSGFGDGAIDARHPFLPLGFAGELELTATYGKDGRTTGFAMYIEAKVVRIANAGGGEGAARQAEAMRIKNANIIPAQIGTTYTIRISGFSRDDSKAFAISDTKLFLCAIMEADGLRPDVAVSPQQWDALASAMAAGKLDRAGRHFLVSTAAVSSKSGNGKMKVVFYPPSAASGEG